MGQYRFFDVADGRPRLRDAASLPNDEIALLHAYGFMNGQGCIDIWDETRHVACLWGDGAPRRQLFAR